MLARVHARVVQVPQLRTLVLRVPLAERVAEAEDPLLGARLLFVAARAADAGVEAELGDRVEQRDRLMRVAALVRRLQHDAALRDRVLDRAHDQPLAKLRRPCITKREHLGEVVAGVDMQQRKRKRARTERLFGEPQQHQRVLAAGEQQRRIRALPGDFAQDVDRFRLEPLEMVRIGARGARRSVRTGRASRAQA